MAKIEEAPGPVVEVNDDSLPKEMVTMVSGTITVSPQTSLPFCVPDYELPVLQFIHGEENVEVTDDMAGEVEVLMDDHNPQDRYDQLYRKYDRANELNPVAQTYRGGARELADAMGKKFVSTGKSGNAKQNAKASAYRVGGKEVKDAK